METPLYDFIHDEWETNNSFVSYVPHRPYKTYEPRSLDFLDDLAGFHVGDMGVPWCGRHRYIYSDLVTRFLILLDSLNSVLRDVVFVLHTADPSTFVLRVSNYYHVHDLYDRHHLYFHYPIHNLWNKIHAVTTIVLKSRHPQFQLLTLLHLPTELITAIIHYSELENIKSLSGTCKTMREICIPEVFRSFALAMKFHRPVTFLHGDSRDDLYARIVRYMERSSTVFIRRLLDLVENDVMRDNMRELLVSNNWEAETQTTMFHIIRPLPPYDSPLVESVYECLGGLLARTRLHRLTLCAIEIPRHLLENIALHPTLRQLHLCFSGPDVTEENVATLPRLQQITSLLLEYPMLSTDVSDSGDQLRTWLILHLFPSLQRLHVYAPVDNGLLRYPPERYHHLLQASCNLERLHIFGSTPQIDELSSWLYLNSHVAPSRLTHFKLHSWSGIPVHRAIVLLNALAFSKHTLRVLAIDGFMDITIAMIGHIAHCLPQLRALTLIRRRNFRQRTSKLCDWGAPVYEYALALKKFPSLQHFGANFNWTPYVYSPAILDHLLAIENTAFLDRERRLDCVMKSEDAFAYNLLKDRRERALCITGPIDVVPSFIVSCPSLRTFAITATDVVFSCAISTSTHAVTGLTTYTLSNVQSSPQTDAFQEWDPKQHSW